MKILPVAIELFYADRWTKQTDRQTDRQTNIPNLVACRSSANAPKNGHRSFS